MRVVKMCRPVGVAAYLGTFSGLPNIKKVVVGIEQ